MWDSLHTHTHHTINQIGVSQCFYGKQLAHDYKGRHCITHTISKHSQHNENINNTSGNTSFMYILQETDQILIVYIKNNTIQIHEGKKRSCSTYK